MRTNIAMPNRRDHEPLLSDIPPGDVLLDQTFFAVDAASFMSFAAMLDGPPQVDERLRHFLSEPSPWDKV